MSERSNPLESPPVERLPEAERGGHLAFVAHEIRNPLSTALWSAELLARMGDEDRGGARGEKLTGMCLRSLSRVRQLIEDHFLCERLDVGGMPMRPEALPVRDIVQELAGRRSPDVGPVEVDLDPGLQLLGDRGLFERAVEALLTAAGRDGAPVRVTSRDAAGEHTNLGVAGADPGAGALDDPKKGSSGDPKGRALALPMARRVAGALGGSLAVEGGAFVLTLPRATAYTARPDPAAHP
jgi:K+-sensing histidine kinase KdpD